MSLGNGVPSMLIVLLAACATNIGAPTRDSRDACLSDANADACYRVGQDAMRGVEVPDGFGNRKALTVEDAALYLSSACEQDYADSCSMLAALNDEQGVPPGQTIGGLLLACKRKGVRNACEGLLSVEKHHPGALTPQMIEIARKGLGR